MYGDGLSGGAWGVVLGGQCRVPIGWSASFTYRPGRRNLRCIFREHFLWFSSFFTFPANSSRDVK